MKLRAIGFSAALALAPVLVACSDDDADDTSDDVSQTIDDAAESVRDTADDVADEVSETADQGAARAQAEALRASLLRALDDDDDAEARSVALVRERADELPGDIELEGLEDGDGDGLDDDGEVSVVVGDSAACLILPEFGDEIDVEGGAC
jgi:hypothetical protein